MGEPSEKQPTIYPVFGKRFQYVAVNSELSAKCLFWKRYTLKQFVTALPC
jgi:hypothetical protein